MNTLYDIERNKTKIKQQQNKVNQTVAAMIHTHTDQVYQYTISVLFLLVLCT